MCPTCVNNHILWLVALLQSAMAVTGGLAKPFVVTAPGAPPCRVALDLRGSTLSRADLEDESRGKSVGGQDAYSIVTWGRFLAEQIGRVSGSPPDVTETVPVHQRAIILSLAENYPELAQQEGSDRSDSFYQALLPLMKFLTRHSYRSVMCPSVMAMRHCSRTALADGREDFYWYRFERMDPAKDPIWMDKEFPWRASPMIVSRGDPRIAAAFHDDEIVTQFGKQYPVTRTTGQ